MSRPVPTVNRPGRRAGGIHKYEDIAADLERRSKRKSPRQPPALHPCRPDPSQRLATRVHLAGRRHLHPPFGARWGACTKASTSPRPEAPHPRGRPGTVVLISPKPSGGYGNYNVDHGGVVPATCYAHQSGFATSTGATVSQGDVIGYVGNTGHSSGTISISRCASTVQPSIRWASRAHTLGLRVATPTLRRICQVIRRLQPRPLNDVLSRTAPADSPASAVLEAGGMLRASEKSVVETALRHRPGVIEVEPIRSLRQRP